MTQSGENMKDFSVKIRLVKVFREALLDSEIPSSGIFE